jgi:large subunit ribosomal protein L30e
MDINWAIKMAVTTGKVHFGLEECEKSVKGKKAKLLIVAANCPHNELKKEKYENVPIYHFPGTTIDLGNACGKPFTVSVLTIVEPGSSTILTDGLITSR